MRSLGALILILAALAPPAQAASHFLAWEAINLTNADVGFRVERCVKTSAGCPMQFVTNLPRSTRQYLDQGVPKQERRCYQVKSTTSPYSNVVCTP